MGFPGGTVVKNLPTNAGDTGDADPIPGSGRSLEVEIETHSSILAWKFYMDRGAWQDIFHGIAKSWKQLSTYARNEKIAMFKRDLMSDRQMEKEYMGKYI